MDAFYLPTDRGARFCILHPARTQPTRGAVLYVHPFAEEMNKSRRMAALQARAFATQGFEVLQIDLHGCGDSSGDFAEASWMQWIEDVETAWDWLIERRGHSTTSVWLWGLRAGCLLITAAVQRRGIPAQLLLWQPVSRGERHLQQFLRTRLAEAAMTEGTRLNSRVLREQLVQEGVLEVSGYPLNAALADGLASAAFDSLPSGSHVHWFEVLSSPELPPSEAAQRQLEAWEQQGCRTTLRTAVGPAFWQTQEINECPALIECTIATMPQ